jgi:UDP-N-acetylmuramate--alanine ligase
MERPHFIAIGGAGMSGIAKILAARGARVSGSDAKESGTTAALRAAGVTVRIGHDPAHLADDATCVVLSSAIRADNPELRAARDRGLPVLHRSDALAALMAGARTVVVAGTHGKTTTTSMLAVAFTELGLDPSYAIGGDLNGPGTNAHQGTGDVFVVEADESDRSFHKYSPDIALILNAELDHHANYASIDEIYDSFHTFAARITQGGTLIVGEHHGAREISARLGDRPDLHHVDVGEDSPARYRIRRITPLGMTSEVAVEIDGRELVFTLSVPGRHYAHNACAALAAGVALGIDAERMATALGAYTGVGRRLQLKGVERGVQVIDSYAHHPTEIASDLEAIRGAAGDGRVLVVFQPHLFSRTQQLATEIATALTLADACVVLDIYPAREDPIPGVTSALIVDDAAARHADITAEHDKDRVPEIIAGMAKPGDLVLTMGAGDVTDVGPRILSRLAADPA